jgi:CRP/FNR family transcriptional regulator
LESFFEEPNCIVFGWGPLQLYPAHAEIIKQDTLSNAVYFIKSGSVKLTWMDGDGHEVIAGLRDQHWLIGAPAVLLGKPYSFTVTTLTPCSLRCISSGKFLELLRINDEFSMQVMRLLCREIFNHGKKLVMLGCAPARARLIDLLCKFISDEYPRTDLKGQIRIHLPLKYKEIAQVIAVTPEHLSRLLKDLEKQKFIVKEKDASLLVNLSYFRRRYGS